MSGTRRVALGFGFAAAAVVVTLAAPRATTHGRGYGWPVQPFGVQHPIRSTFGDPRTMFAGPPTLATLYHGAGSFSFHTGVDIAAPDGSPVYAVVSGTVTSTAACKVIVHSPGRVVFQYWHIFPSVKTGQRVTAFATVLGRIRTSYAHVHLVEFQGGKPTNPLAPGHLTPYVDTTRPVAEHVLFRRPGEPSELMPELVRGAVEIDVPAYDIPRPAAPGEWRTMPTAPALVRWHIEQASDGRIERAERTAFDVRARLPQSAFWNVYARGTRQNDPTFRKHRYWMQEGRFIFRLGVVDTRRMRDGIYRVVVTVSDVGGNSATTRATFLVYNHRLWPPETRQA